MRIFACIHAGFGHSRPTAQGGLEARQGASPTFCLRIRNNLALRLNIGALAGIKTALNDWSGK